MKRIDPELEREEWVMIGHLSYDVDAEIVSSLFESHGIPVLVQGRNHRRMLGFIGGHIHLRVLVPKIREEEGLSLLKTYHQQRDDENFSPPSSEELEGERNWLLFSDTSRKLGIALFLSAFLGFGLASLSAGLWWLTLLLATLQASAYVSELGTVVAPIFGSTYEIYQVNAPSYVSFADLLISWVYILVFSRSKN